MSALQQLLNLGLVAIGSDDSRFEKIQSAATAFTAKLKENPELLIPATLIAINSEMDDENALFALVEELVLVEWRTLRNTHVNRPRELLRSVIIDALMTSIQGNPEVAGVVFNTAASPHKFGQVKLGKAAVVVEQLLNDASQIAEDEAIKRAELGIPAAKARKKAKSKHQNLSLEIDAAIKAADILTYVEGASGPQNAEGQAAQDPNPHWPNTGQPWSNEFAPRMTVALIKAVNLSCRHLATSLSKSLESYLGSVEDRLTSEVRQAEQLCVEMSASQHSSRMRLDVLWWSEALYSSSQGCSYRKLEMHDAAVVAAIDLSEIVPALSPASVYYVLGETIHRLASMQEKDDSKKIKYFFEKLVNSQIDFGEILHRTNDNEAAISLLDAIGETSKKDKQQESNPLASINLDIALELSFDDFAMWVFRDIQARRLVEELK